MKAEITNKNQKGQFHGYQEWYYSSGISFRSTCKNNLYVGYHESHLNSIKLTCFFIR